MTEPEFDREQERAARKAVRAVVRRQMLAAAQVLCDRLVVDTISGEQLLKLIAGARSQKLPPKSNLRRHLTVVDAFKVVVYSSTPQDNVYNWPRDRQYFEFPRGCTVTVERVVNPLTVSVVDLWGSGRAVTLVWNGKSKGFYLSSSYGFRESSGRAATTRMLGRGPDRSDR